MKNMHKTLYGAALVGCLAIASSVNALECKNSDCTKLGYSKTNVENCAKYVHCPFDTEYKTCVQLEEEYTLDTCPEGYKCDVKYKKTDQCDDGYDLYSDGTCKPRCTGDTLQPKENYDYTKCVDNKGITRYTVLGCKKGYIEDDDKTGCYNCGKCIRVNISGVNYEYVTFTGKSVLVDPEFNQVTGSNSMQAATDAMGEVGRTYLITGCKNGYKAKYTGECITSCYKTSPGGSGGGGTKEEPTNAACPSTHPYLRVGMCCNELNDCIEVKTGESDEDLQQQIYLDEGRR